MFAFFKLFKAVCYFFMQEYNDVSDDMRDDEETKTELHQRVDDLRENLWSICDDRKAQSEKEREGVMTDGWLDDRLGVLSNYYITQMQAEVDRYQDTVRTMKDYYRGMEGQMPDEQNNNYSRIPLIEVGQIHFLHYHCNQNCSFNNILLAW